MTPKVTCSGVPSGKRCRQVWTPLPVLAEKYIHFPSGDQAASVHCAGAGPTGFPGELPSKGTNRQGSHERGVHLDHEDLLPIGREIGAVGHAGLGRHVDSALLGAALRRGHDGHLNSPAGHFGKQDQGRTGGAPFAFWNPGQPCRVGQEAAAAARQARARSRCPASRPSSARVVYAIRAPSGENLGLILSQVVVRELHRLPVGQKLDVNLPRTDERALARG